MSNRIWHSYCILMFIMSLSGCRGINERNLDLQETSGSSKGPRTLDEIADLLKGGKDTRAHRTTKAMPIPIDSNIDWLIDAPKIKGDLPTDFSLVSIQSSIDLRPFATPVRDQGSTLMCTSFAVVAGIEIMARKQFGEDITVSESHYWSHYQEPTWTFGLPNNNEFLLREQDWSFPNSKPAQNPICTVKLTSSRPISGSLLEILSALNQGHAVALAFYLNTSSASPTSTGIIDSTIPTRQTSHAVAIVGYRVDKSIPGGGFLVLKNSFGTDWGDEGYGYIPFDYCSKHKCSAVELVSIEKHSSGKCDFTQVIQPEIGVTPGSPSLWAAEVIESPLIALPNSSSPPPIEPISKPAVGRYRSDIGICEESLTMNASGVDLKLEKCQWNATIPMTCSNGTCIGLFLNWEFRMDSVSANGYTLHRTRDGQTAPVARFTRIQ